MNPLKVPCFRTTHSSSDSAFGTIPLKKGGYDPLRHYACFKKVFLKWFLAFFQLSLATSPEPKVEANDISKKNYRKSKKCVFLVFILFCPHLCQFRKSFVLVLLLFVRSFRPSECSFTRSFVRSLVRCYIIYRRRNCL